MAGDVRAFDRIEIHRDVVESGSIKGFRALQSIKQLAAVSQIDKRKLQAYGQSRTITQETVGASR
jgi:hypothetical protein